MMVLLTSSCTKRVWYRGGVRSPNKRILKWLVNYTDVNIIVIPSTSFLLVLMRMKEYVVDGGYDKKKNSVMDYPYMTLDVTGVTSRF